MSDQPGGENVWGAPQPGGPPPGGAPGGPPPPPGWGGPPPGPQHCRNCGSAVAPMAIACTTCGAPPMAGTAYCWSCAAPTGPGAIVCVRCGVALSSAALNADPTLKSKLVAGLLGILLGAFGVHRFYLGYTTIGVLQIVATVLTCGIAGLWGFIEGILILVGNTITTDAKGRPLRD